MCYLQEGEQRQHVEGQREQTENPKPRSLASKANLQSASRSSSVASRRPHIYLLSSYVAPAPPPPAKARHSFSFSCTLHNSPRSVEIPQISQKIERFKCFKAGKTLNLKPLRGISISLKLPFSAFDSNASVILLQTAHNLMSSVQF